MPVRPVGRCQRPWNKGLLIGQKKPLEPKRSIIHGGSGIDAGRKEHSRQRGRPGTDMDTAHSVDPARGFPQKTFSKQIPMKRPGQPAELTTAYDVLADPLSNYLSGATTAVTGGKPFP
jgi:hypothetical protein